MKYGTWVAIYFVVWWICLFAVLPLRVRSQAEAGEVVPGSEAAAPARPQLAFKALVTTLLAAIVCAGLWALLNSGLSLDDVPFLPRYAN